MRKLTIMLLLLSLLPLAVAAGDNWILHASDGSTSVNGTDICVDIYGTPICLSQAVANATGDITAVNAGDGLTGGGTSGSVTLNVSADTCAGGEISKYNGTHFNCVADATGGGGQGKAGDGVYLTNDSTTMYWDVTLAGTNLSVNSSDNWDDLDTFNDTQMDNNGGILSITISWFSSLFDTLFGLKDTDGLTEGSTNLYENSTFNQSLTDTLYAVAGSGNSSWNESHADTLYADISVTGDNSSWNETHADTLYAPLGSGNSSWNESHADTLYSDITEPLWADNSSTVARTGDCPAGQFVQNTTTGGVECAAAGGSGDITSVQADDKYVYNGSDNGDVLLAFNETQLNLTVDDRDQDTNCSVVGSCNNVAYNLTGFDTDDLAEGSTNLYDNQTWNETHADTLYADISVTGDNSSWNETHADTLYIEQANEADLNVNSSTWWAGLTGWVEGWFIETSDELDFNVTKLNETGDARYVNIDGDTMTGALNMSENPIYVDGVTLKVLSEKNANIDGPAYGIYMTGPSAQNLPHLIIQSGGDSQANVFLRSVMIADEIAGFHNTTNATDCIAYMDEIGEDLMIDCNTTTSGADLLVGDDFQAIGDAFFKDEQGEWHNMNRMLTHNDALQDDLILDQVEVYTTNNGTHTMVFLNSTSGADIEVNFDLAIYSLGSPLVNVTLVNGLNESPQSNFVWIGNGGTPSMQVGSVHPGAGVEAIDIATYFIGENGVIQGFTPVTQQVYEAVHGAQKRAKVSGPLYVLGYDPSVDADEFNLSTGRSIIIYDLIACQNMTIADDSFFYINSSGDWVYGTDLSIITEYSDGTLIGGSRYIPLVAGVIPTSQTTCQLVFVTPSNPGTEYISCKQAEEDIRSVRNVFPPSSLVKEQYTATTWMLMSKSSDEFCQFQNGDYSRKIAGDVTGGGGAPTSPPTDHAALDNLAEADSGHTGFLAADGSDSLTANWDQGAFNLTNILSYFFGTANNSNNWITSNNGTLTGVNVSQFENQGGLLHLVDGVIGTITSIVAGDGMTFSTVTEGAATVTMGTPSTLNSGTSNGVSANSHLHAITSATPSDGDTTSFSNADQIYDWGTGEFYDLGNSYGYYNSTDFDIADYYLTSNPFSFYNSTNPQPGTNSSWNESHADTLYYDLGNSYGYWNDTYATFNESYADTLYAAIGDANNDSWTEVVAQNRFMNQTATTNLNMTDTYNITLGGCTSSWNGSCKFEICPTTTSIQC